MAAKHTITQPSKIVPARRANPRPRQASRCPKCSDAEITRRYIGLAIVALIAGSAIAGIWEPAALAVLERLLPSLTLMCGYYYGRLHA